MKCYCCDCKSVFDENELKPVFEWVPYGDTSVEWQSGVECPECGSEEIEDAATCEICGEDFGESEMCGNVCKVCAITGITADLFFEFAEIWDEVAGSYLDDFFALKVLKIETPQPDREFHNSVVRLWNFIKDDIPITELTDYVLAYCKPDWLDFIEGRY